VSKNTKITVVITAAAVLVSGLVLGFVIGWGNDSSYPDVDVNEPNDVREFVESEEFQEMDEQERREFFRNTMQKTIVSRADEYVKLSEDRKTQYLDNIIDQMRKRINRMRRARRDGDRDFGPPQAQQDEKNSRGGGEQRRRPRRMDASAMRGRFESMSADNRAKITQFMMDLHNRVQQRGIAPGR
jgi:hypothetical protein